jgi:FkbM family methyltransferase
MEYYKHKYLYGHLYFINKSDAKFFFFNKKKKKLSPTYQEYINDTLKIYYKPNTNILDIGSNIGIFSLSFAKLAPECKIHSFEPVSITNKLLNKTIETNNINNVEIYNYGLGDKNEEVIINIDPNRLGSSSIKQNLKKNTEKILIKRLDDINIENISFIKVDIQEYEYEFLLGAKETLKNNNIVLILEIPTRNNYEIDIHNRCDKFLNSLNYIKYKKIGSKDWLFIKKNKFIILSKI